MSRPRGRPPLTRSVLSFEDESILVPSAALVDTSFVVAAMVPSQTLHRQCLDYLVKLAEDRTELAFSRLLRLELWEAVFLIALKERHPNDWRRSRHDGRVRRRAARLMDDAVGAWQQALDSFVWTEYGLEDVMEHVPRLMADHGLGSYDAVHAATAAVAGIGSILTLDAGFAVVPEAQLTVYIDRGRVAVCRERRNVNRRRR